jgi:hypothetical protein
MDSKSGILTVVMLAVAYIILMPFVFIWSVNQLFALGVEYSVINWIAAVALNLFFSPSPKFSLNKG